jgi:hypothetical protein
MRLLSSQLKGFAFSFFEQIDSSVRGWMSELLSNQDQAASRPCNKNTESKREAFPLVFRAWRCMNMLYAVCRSSS